MVRYSGICSWSADSVHWRNRADAWPSPRKPFGTLILVTKKPFSNGQQSSIAIRTAESLVMKHVFISFWLLWADAYARAKISDAYDDAYGPMHTSTIAGSTVRRTEPPASRDLTKP